MAILCIRSPLATAPITRAISVVGRPRSEISAFTDSTFRAHAPSPDPNDMRSASFPSLPTALLTRSIPRDVLSSRSIMSLSVSAIFPLIPVQSSGMRAEKSPFFTAVKTLNNSLGSNSPPDDCPLVAVLIFAPFWCIARTWLLLRIGFSRDRF